MAATYEKWQARLAGETVPIHPSDPEAGFYRCKDKTGRYFGVAIWPNGDGDSLCGLFDKRTLNTIEAVENIWTWAAKNPVTEAAYRQWEKDGNWPDVDEAVIAPPSPGVGHNAGPTDEAEIIAE